MYDLLLKHATIVDPANGLHAVRDLAIQGRTVAAVEVDLPSDAAHRTLDLEGLHVVPGIIDSHVHVCRPFGGTHGYTMMARVGVTTAIDLAGYPEPILEGIGSARGMSIGFVYPIVPEVTVPDRDPDDATLTDLTHTALAKGALGTKILGGHYPITPEAAARAIEVGHQAGAHVAVHAGTTATGSNVDGVLELLQLANGRRIQLAHVNSYCRGQITGDPIAEAATVLAALREASGVVSESYLGLVNGAVATCADGVPTSNVVKTCLRTGGFEATRGGLLLAIEAGWGLVNRVIDGETRLLSGEEGAAYFLERDTQVGISFPVNSPGAGVSIATNRRDGVRGAFTVDAISTDGGAYPRNTIVSQGLALVRYGALSIDEFALKTSTNPAKMFGLDAKGHLGVGADADITVLDLDTLTPYASVARGQLIMQQGELVGSGGCLLVTENAQRYLAQHAPAPQADVVHVPR